MQSISLSIEEFAARRRKSQDELAEHLLPDVTAYLQTGSEAVFDALSEAWVEILEDENADAKPGRALDDFLSAARKALDKATPESDPKVTSLMLATAAINSATMSAADQDTENLVLEWVTMHDDVVRSAHRAVEGQQRPAGEPFEVAGVEMPYPGWPGAPISLWINCRCVVRPAYEAEFSAKIEQMRALVAAPDVQDTTLSIMAVPAPDQGLPTDEEAHATLVYFGEYTDGVTIDQIEQWVFEIAQDAKPFSAKVKGLEPLGEANAVWMLDESDLNGIHEGLMASPVIKSVYDAADTTKYPEYTAHVTATYDGDVTPEMEQVTEITFDTLSVWHGSDRFDYPLGAKMDEDEITEIEEIDETPEEETEVEEVEDSRVPWHGVLAPDNVRSGDGRMFTNLGRTRELPLPLTWQERSAGGHDDSITVAMIEKVQMIDGLMHASGHFLSSVEEADEVIGLLAEFGKYGVSVDADDIGEMAFDEENDTETFDDPRVCSASIVQIPAYPEAYVALGEHPILDAVEPVEEEGEPEEDVEDDEVEDLVASMPAEITPEEFKDLAPGITEDGPGWLTHPVDTDRLRDYWVRGPGAAKIAWGAPGDFNRCRVNLAKYVKPQFLNGYCANRHFDALKIWPGEHHGAETVVPEGEIAPALNLVAAGGWNAPSEWFVEPTEEECPEGEGIVFTDEGRVFGYIAEWGVCHVGLAGTCTEAPFSQADYAYFRTGQVETPDGPVKVGSLTFATGHAAPRLAAAPAVAHYDDTGTAFAYVASGENDRGIWFSGMLRPGLTDEALGEIKAAGRLSGDWRRIGNNLELVAALAVNTPGFPIIKSSMVAGAQISLVAAGMVGKPDKVEVQATKIEVSVLAAAVADEMEARVKRRDRMAALKEKVN